MANFSRNMAEYQQRLDVTLQLETEKAEEIREQQDLHARADAATRSIEARCEDMSTRLDAIQAKQRKLEDLWRKLEEQKSALENNPARLALLSLDAALDKWFAEDDS